MEFVDEGSFNKLKQSSLRAFDYKNLIMIGVIEMDNIVEMNEKYCHKFYHFFLVAKASLKKNLLELIRYPANSIFVVLFPIFWTLPIYLLIYSFAPDGVSYGLYAYTGTKMFFSYYLIGMIGGLFIIQIFWGMGFSLKRLMDIGVLETIWSYPMNHVHFTIGESVYNLVETIYSEVASVLIVRYVFGFVLPF